MPLSQKRPRAAAAASAHPKARRELEYMSPDEEDARPAKKVRKSSIIKQQQRHQVSSEDEEEEEPLQPMDLEDGAVSNSDAESDVDPEEAAAAEARKKARKPKPVGEVLRAPKKPRKPRAAVASKPLHSAAYEKRLSDIRRRDRGQGRRVHGLFAPKKCPINTTSLGMLFKSLLKFHDPTPEANVMLSQEAVQCVKKILHQQLITFLARARETMLHEKTYASVEEREKARLERSVKAHHIEAEVRERHTYMPHGLVLDEVFDGYLEVVMLDEAKRAAIQAEHALQQHQVEELQRKIASLTKDEEELQKAHQQLPLSKRVEFISLKNHLCAIQLKKAERRVTKYTTFIKNTIEYAQACEAKLPLILATKREIEEEGMPQAVQEAMKAQVTLAKALIEDPPQDKEEKKEYSKNIKRLRRRQRDADARVTTRKRQIEALKTRHVKAQANLIKSVQRQEANEQHLLECNKLVTELKKQLKRGKLLLKEAEDMQQ